MAAKKLTYFRMAGFGMGAVGFNLFYSGLNLYLLFYYTDVVGMRPAIAGLIFMLPVLWDAITDPIMGGIASRTRTRFGSFRPYILLGAPVMSLCFVFMFAAPLLFPGAIVAACAISHIMFRTAFTVVAIPHGSLLAVMTYDSKERSRLAGFRTLFGLAGGLLTAAITLELARYYGGEDLKLGFLYMAITFAIASTLIMALVFLVTFENPLPHGTRRRPTVAQSWKFLSRNTPFWILFTGILAASVGNSIGTKTMVYYVSYNAGAPGSVSLVLTLGLLAAGLAVPFWTFMFSHIKKRTVWLLGTGGFFINSLILYVLAPTDVSTLIGFRLVDGVCLSAVIVAFWAMTPDTVEYGEWKSGDRDEGILFGINEFALKAATGIGVGVLGFALGAIGYSAQGEQSATALEGIKALAFLFPMLAYAFSFTCLYFYPIDLTLHQRLMAAIAFRNRSHQAKTTGA
ncbi:MAG: glycoside-pentoside-hexuronide (GPH):cation symporter [Pseudomonadota bacterium]